MQSVLEGPPIQRITEDLSSWTKRAGRDDPSSRRSERREPCSHPDDPSIARGGRTSDSFAPAKPVPVSETAQRSLCFCRHAIAANSYSEGNNSKPVPAALTQPLSEVLPPLDARVVRMTEGLALLA